MDENVRRVLSEVGPYSDKDTLPGGLLIFGSLNYLKMHIIIIITGLRLRLRSPKNFFSAPRASVWAKNKGVPGPLPYICHSKCIMLDCSSFTIIVVERKAKLH